MKTKNSINNKLATKLDTRLKIVVVAGIFSIVLAAIIFTISNFGIQQNSNAAIFPSGTYRIGGSSSTPAAGCQYVSIKTAMTAMNGKTINGPVTFILTSYYTGYGETYPITLNAIAGASDVNRITFRPDNNTNITLTSNSVSSVVKFNAAAYYTLDGYSVNDSTTRRISIINTNNAAKTAAVWVCSQGINNGCNGVIIKNCNIAAFKTSNMLSKVTFGVFVGGTTIDYGFASTVVGPDNNNISIINNKIYRSNFGIKVSATLDNNANNLTIKNNIIGADLSTDYIGLYGIELDNVTNANILGNTVYNIIQSGISSSSYMPCGLWIGNINNSTISKNNIKSIKYSGTSAYGGTGMELYNWGVCNNILISNNTISDIAGPGTTSAQTSNVGIRLWDLSSGAYINNARIYYNSINISYGSCSSNATTADIYIGDGNTNIDLRNNVLANTSNCSNRYSVYIGSSDLPFSEINYNNYYSTGKIGYFSSTGTATTLDDWRVITGSDLRSVKANPAFTSTTDLTPNLSSANAWYLHGNGCQIAEINSDINGNARSIAPAQGATDIGAYEFDHSDLPAPPTVTNTTAISDGATTDFKIGEMETASIKWHGSSLPTSVAVKYYSGVNAPNLPADVNCINAYWEITPTGGTGFTYDITLKYDEAIFGNIIDESQMMVSKKHGTDAWEDFDNCVIDIPNKTITFNGLSSFSLFTIKGGSGSHLPISLISFTGKLNDKDVDLNWKTATEINNDYFTLERSTDCKTFDIVSKINGAGNSNMVLKYDYTDANVAEITKATKLYYRLKQTDFDGKYTYSGIIAINLTEESSSPFELLSANPNPFQDNLYISVSSIAEGNALLKLYDMNGKMVKEQTSEIMEGINTITLSNNADLKKGTYLINVEMNNQKSKVIKVVKY